MKQIAQGAEAIISLDKNKIIKNRVPKKYRHPILDEKIRRQRTKSEAKLLTKASEIINAPQIINQDKFTIEMQHINGERLSETLNQKSEQEQFQIMKQIGEQIGKLHDKNIIHGDLTTSNTILAKDSSSKKSRLEINKLPEGQKDDASHLIDKCAQSTPISSPTQPKVFLIDFGLGFISTRIEDKAVDLHLIKQALEAKHWENHNRLFFQFLEAYQPEDRDKILQQLIKVEARGRYKH